MTTPTLAIASRGATTAVDWEQRVSFERVRADRLARAKAALEASHPGALLLFDPNNIRHVTSTHIGECARDKNARYALLPRSERPILWDFGSAARRVGLGDQDFTVVFDVLARMGGIETEVVS